MISSLLPLPMGEVPLEGAERACLPSQSLCDSSPKVGAKEKRIVTGGNPWKGPRQCEHWLAMTCVLSNTPETRDPPGAGLSQGGLSFQRFTSAVSV